MQMGNNFCNCCGGDFDETGVWMHDNKPVYLMLDHILINLCDALYMLTDWTKSEGAMIEHEIAVRGGKKIFYQDDEASEKELEACGIIE